MNSTLRLILILISAICFGLAAVQVPSKRINLIGAGLFTWVLTVLIPLVH